MALTGNFLIDSGIQQQVATPVSGYKPTQTEENIKQYATAKVESKPKTRTQDQLFQDMKKLESSGFQGSQEDLLKEVVGYAKSKGISFDGVNSDEILGIQQDATKIETSQDISGLDIGVKTGEAISDFGKGFKFQSNVDDGIVKSGLKFLANLPGNTAQLAGDLISIASDPLGTAKSVKTLAEAGIATGFNKLFMEEGQEVFTSEEAQQVAESIGNELDKLGEPGRIKELLIENPADVLLSITGGLGVAKNVAKSKGLTSLANKLEKAEALTNPITIQATALKTAGQGVSKVGEIGARTYTKLTGVNYDSVKSIVKNPELFKQAETGLLSRNSLGNETVKAIDTRIDDLGELGKEYANLRKGEVISNGTDLNTKLSNITEKIDLKELTNLDSKVLKEAEGYIARYSGDITDSNLLSLRKQIDSILYDPATGVARKLSPNGQRIIGNIRKGVDDLAKEKIVGLKELDAKFAPEITELNKIKSLIYDAKGNIKDNYIQQISNLTGKGKELKLERIKKIIPDIEDKINALKALEDVELAKGIKVGTYGQAAVAGVGLASGIVPAIATFILTHPSTLVGILKAYNVTTKTISNITNKIKNGIKLTKEEGVIVGDALKSQIKDGIGEGFDNLADKLGTRTKLMGEQGIGRDKTALLKGSDEKIVQNIKDNYELDSIKINLSNKELKSIYDYTGENFTKRSKTSKDVINAISKLPEYNGTTYRGISMKESELKKLLDEGIFEDSGITSTSKSLSIANKFGQSKGEEFVIFKIKAKSGRDIERASQFMQEQEVVFLPNTKFKILNSTKKDLPSIIEGEKRKATIIELVEQAKPKLLKKSN